MHPHGVYCDFIGKGDWQARVQTLLDLAGMVVLAMGDSAGIEWEIEQAIYELFSPLVEKYFDLTMPPFTESTHLIGFDADGTPVMAPNAPRKRWIFTGQARVADAVSSQLQAVLVKVQPLLHQTPLVRFK